MEDNLSKIIEKYLKGTLEVKAFNASLDVLASTANPLRFSFFSLGIRELVNHIVDRLAPNEEVVQCCWWDDNNGKRTTPKRTEKMQYAIRGGLSDEFVSDVLEVDLVLITNRIHQVVDELSEYVHYDESTFNIDHASGNKLVEDTLLVVKRFFETIEELKGIVSDALEESLNKAISIATIDDVLVEVDILSTHYIVEGSDITEIVVRSIDHEHIDVQVSGSVDIEHQYGSDGDYARGDGVRFSDSYPFEINLQLDVEYPLEINIETDDIIVDTDKFYDNSEEEEEDDWADHDMEEATGEDDREDPDRDIHF
ncbi:hypothetical protein ACFQI7_13020 [Paenibacillus allorhizosphaerae]|uniref:Uncharacterized protein n=1 Tax=Paenibacillus allorhizosphaerae TaxID=2849866 RepID=A0ABM8VL55_9BACL|nr:hypothetical protein [Paenibacillus allorhizosphaerae]CAG7648141.1 hypothetical protein PAECIP111802_04135 [Paenibacillus allorhizosphaerae]